MREECSRASGKQLVRSVRVTDGHCLLGIRCLRTLEWVEEKKLLAEYGRSSGAALMIDSGVVRVISLEGDYNKKRGVFSCSSALLRIHWNGEQIPQRSNGREKRTRMRWNKTK